MIFMNEQFRPRNCNTSMKYLSLSC